MAYTIDLTGKTALVTGGASGIGYAIAEGFQNPMHVIVMTPASLRQNYQNEIKKHIPKIFTLNKEHNLLDGSRRHAS